MIPRFLIYLLFEGHKEVKVQNGTDIGTFHYSLT
jgi:hypothetical protein